MTGTYISATVAPLSDRVKQLLRSMGPLAGRKVGSNRLHTTILYSHATVDEATVKTVLGQIKTPFEAEIVGAACFDALPDANGARDGEVSTVVLRLASPLLHVLHQTFKMLGGTHTYPTFEPHVSVWYGVPKLMARDAVDAFNQTVIGYDPRPIVRFTELTTAPIEENWVAANIGERK